MTNTTNTERLKPCPFCGGTEQHIAAGAVLDQVYCEQCDAYGPMGKPGLAIAAWNTRAALAEAEGQVADKWDGGEGWEALAWALCAEESGEEACSDLIWEGGPIPEPWGERWQKYEDEAKRLIALVREHAPGAAAPEAPAPVVEPVAYVELTDAECDEFRRHQGDFNSMLRATHRAGYLRGANHPPAPREPLTDGQIDAGLDLILRAAGSALRHYTMQKSRDDMRAALRSVIGTDREGG